MCNLDNARLAVVRTEDEGKELTSWLETQEPWLSGDKDNIDFFLGMKTSYKNNLRIAANQ